MGNVKDWRDGKLMLTVLIAEGAAGAAASCHELLNSWRACNGFSELLSEQDEKEWLRLYTGHGRLQSGVLDAFSPFIPCMPSGDEARVLWREMMRMQANGAEYVRAALENIPAEELRVLFAEAAKCGQEWMRSASLPVGELPEPSAKQLQEIFSSQEVVFFFKVWVRAWLEYGETVTWLFWRATRLNKPDLEALKKLITLDPRVIHHPLVERVIHCRDRGQARFREAAVGQALGKPLAATLSIGKVKSMLASLISRISELLGDQLNAEEIRELFDSIAREQGQLCDFDLPAGKEAWSKAIQRGRRSLRFLPEPDKDSLEAVRALRKRAG